MKRTQVLREPRTSSLPPLNRRGSQETSERPSHERTSPRRSPRGAEETQAHSVPVDVDLRVVPIDRDCFIRLQRDRSYQQRPFRAVANPEVWDDRSRSVPVEGAHSSRRSRRKRRNWEELRQTLLKSEDDALRMHLRHANGINPKTPTTATLDREDERNPFSVDPVINQCDVQRLPDARAIVRLYSKAREGEKVMMDLMKKQVFDNISAVVRTAMAVEKKNEVTSTGLRGAEAVEFRLDTKVAAKLTSKGYTKAFGGLNEIHLSPKRQAQGPYIPGQGARQGPSLTPPAGGSLPPVIRGKTGGDPLGASHNTADPPQVKRKEKPVKSPTKAPSASRGQAQNALPLVSLVPVRSSPAPKPKQKSKASRPPRLDRVQDGAAVSTDTSTSPTATNPSFGNFPRKPSFNDSTRTSPNASGHDRRGSDADRNSAHDRDARRRRSSATITATPKRRRSTVKGGGGSRRESASEGSPQRRESFLRHYRSRSRILDATSLSITIEPEEPVYHFSCEYQIVNPAATLSEILRQYLRMDERRINCIHYDDLQLYGDALDLKMPPLPWRTWRIRERGSSLVTFGRYLLVMLPAAPFDLLDRLFRHLVIGSPRHTAVNTYAVLRSAAFSSAEIQDEEPYAAVFDKLYAECVPHWPDTLHFRQPPELLSRIWELFVQYRRGNVRGIDFAAFQRQFRQTLRGDNLLIAFRQNDTNHDDFIEFEEYVKLLWPGFDRTEKIVDEADVERWKHEDELLTAPYTNVRSLELPKGFLVKPI